MKKSPKTEISTPSRPFSDEELCKELVRRQRVRNMEENAANRAKSEFVLKHAAASGDSTHKRTTSLASLESQ